MSGTIGVPCNDSARYHFFTASLENLQRPVNTATDFALGSDRIRGRNTLVRRSLERGSEWILFLDDDHSFGPHLLMRLLSHREPIIASLYMRRQFPFSPVAFNLDYLDVYEPILLHDYPVDEGLVQVRAAGTGGMLIRSEVFRALVDQGLCEDGVWFRDGEASEDLTFCDKAREAGFPIFVDLQARLGHCTTSIIWPSHYEGRWVIGADVAADYHAMFPIATREEMAAQDAERAAEAAEAAEGNGASPHAAKAAGAV